MATVHQIYSQKKVENIFPITCSDAVRCGRGANAPWLTSVLNGVNNNITSLGTQNANQEQRLASMEGKLIVLTDEEYNALEVKDPNKFYFIYEE